jgi:hypothetical protein
MAVLGARAPGDSYATCPNCGAASVNRLKKRDHIDAMSRTPWSAIQKLRGGSLYHCPICRIQFFDCRPSLLITGAVSKNRD